MKRGMMIIRKADSTMVNVFFPTLNGSGGSTPSDTRIILPDPYGFEGRPHQIQEYFNPTPTALGVNPIRYRNILIRPLRLRGRFSFVNVVTGQFSECPAICLGVEDDG